MVRLILVIFSSTETSALSEPQMAVRNVQLQKFQLFSAALVPLLTHV